MYHYQSFQFVVLLNFCSLILSYKPNQISLSIALTSQLHLFPSPFRLSISYMVEQKIALGCPLLQLTQKSHLFNRFCAALLRVLSNLFQPSPLQFTDSSFPVILLFAYISCLFLFSVKIDFDFTAIHSELESTTSYRTLKPLFLSSFDLQPNNHKT